MVVYSAFTRLILSLQPKFVLSFNQDLLQPNLKIKRKNVSFHMLHPWLCEIPIITQSQTKWLLGWKA